MSGADTDPRDAGPDGSCASPVGDDELARLLRGLEGHRRIVLAVSGGADSMALLHLAARWHRTEYAREGRPELVVATVDHGLRVGSRAEADWVAGEAARLGLRHHLLTWAGERTARGIQVAAREARYGLLLGLARRIGATAIVTAHNRNDQAETLLMRLARGSGVDGLAAMRPVQSAEGIAAAVADTEPGAPDLAAISLEMRRPEPRGVELHRPLLGVERARLVATLRGLGARWVEDPSNANPAFERTRLRAASAQLAAAGLTAAAVARSAHRLARASAALDEVARRLCQALVDLHGGAWASLSVTALAVEPEELRVRVLARVLGLYGGTGRVAPIERAEQLEAWLGGRDATAARAATTIAGCRVRLDAGELRVWREWGRQGLPELLLLPGNAAIWDGRFRVTVASEVVEAVSIGPLGAVDARRFAVAMPPISSAIARTLPAVRRKGELIAQPHLGLRSAGITVVWAH